VRIGHSEKVRVDHHPINISQELIRKREEPAEE